jgi:protein-S-isoprenylcysteine O-methyltransferase Ste14
MELDRFDSSHRRNRILTLDFCPEVVARGTSHPDVFKSVRAGPYRFTRNPIYIAYLGIWLGWAIFFGSIGVLVVWLLWCLVAIFNLVPREERDLEAAFGESYLQYKNRVPRWFGKANL